MNGENLAPKAADTPVTFHSLFIADLHLSLQAPGTARIFLNFLNGRARQAKHLYILGDLFNAWPGDDCLDNPEFAFGRIVVHALHQLTQSGVKLWLMHGNRDFLIGSEFIRRTGATPLPDPYRLSLPGRSFVLSHGDMLCIDDQDYLNFRAKVRDPAWQVEFLNRPLLERRAIAAQMRRESTAAKQEKIERQQQYLMDLNPEATENFLRYHGHITFIHGHTHLPARHVHLIDGIPVERWVLADWKENAGECLAWNGRQLERIPLT